MSFSHTDKPAAWQFGQAGAVRRLPGCAACLPGWDGAIPCRRLGHRRGERAGGRLGQQQGGRVSRRRGTALVELAVSMPVLAMVIALTFLSGYAMSNKQHVEAAGRYVAWARSYGQPAPTAEELNTMFFGMKADGIEIRQDQGPRDTLDDLIAEADSAYSSAGVLMDRTIDGAETPSREVTISAEFPSSITAWQRFIAPRSARLVRDTGQWQRGELSYLGPIREQFLGDLDAVVQDIQGPGGNQTPIDQLKDALRRLYSQRW